MDSTLYVCIVIVDNNQDTNIGIQEKQNGATEVPPSTEASLDQSGDEIHGQSFSHYNYYKSFLVSFSPLHPHVLIGLGVNCGGHRADSCSICPQDGLGWRGYVKS